ncbi:hypothetical protein FZC35_01200 [Candidatus Cytomitobacter indipagum]|uniref:Uncharacterized protein n=1 Tax=Candidatus Cytomitobacter indipagum TaxID=2601575 RepID=A0A5C0UD84_9PROT|nr:hypothetical protein [Candidatus Cytomitobacter indipagum]QEK37996.1 hypothetical protein FZC35_01200 [Candidatus Cytomitobacter indipagum]
MNRLFLMLLSLSMINAKTFINICEEKTMTLDGNKFYITKHKQIVKSKYKKLRNKKCKNHAKFKKHYNREKVILGRTQSSRTPIHLMHQN